jgi:amino acid adenylation domain-containing protein
MSGAAPLHCFLEQSAARHPARVAVEDPAGPTITYGALARLADRVRDRLTHAGVDRGDRVGVHMHKSIDAVACIFGILESGAAYVPVDADAPPARCGYILNDCEVKAVITERRLEPALRVELESLGRVPRIFAVDTSATGSDSGVLPLELLLDAESERDPAPATETVRAAPDELAYILYTSGSTGKPKGVMLTHGCATSYVDWCSTMFAPDEADVFSSHAPFHFDLSVLDLYVSLRHGARLVLIGEELGKDPQALAQIIAHRRISVWYSVPSILNFLAQYGKLDRHDYSALRLVLFAGEVFPVSQIRALQVHWPHPRYFNLYGPTETNVCTYHELPGTTPPDRTEPFPIGRCCSHLRCRVVEPDGSDVRAGCEGELVVTGPGVMVGYWNLPEQNRRAFLVDADGTRWYRTGDLVVEDPHDGYIFHGRRDRMVKRRGYRIELGEIEAGLSTHDAIREVAVVALPDAAAGVRLKAFLSVRDGKRLSMIQLKQYSVERLPRYMVPDFFGFVEALPRTATDKIDYQALEARG